jgi:hypothetical protein
MNWHLILFASLAFCMECSNHLLNSQPGYIFQADGTLTIQEVQGTFVEIPSGYAVSKVVFSWCKLDSHPDTEKFIRQVCSFPTLRTMHIEAVQATEEIIRILAETCASNLGITELHLKFYSQQLAEAILSAFAQMPPRLRLLEVEGWQKFGEECEFSFVGKENVLEKLEELHYTEQKKSPFSGMPSDAHLMPHLKSLKISFYVEEDFPTTGRMYVLHNAEQTIESLSIVLLDYTPRSEREITDSIGKLTNLKELDLVCGDDQISFDALFQALEGKNLEKLSISGSIVDAGSVLDSCARISSCKTLQIGHLNLLPLNPNVTLKHIEVEDVFSDNSIEFLNQLFALLPSLETLALTFTGQDANAFVDGLSSLASGAHLHKLSIKTEVEEDFFAKLKKQATLGTFQRLQVFTLWIPNDLANAKELPEILNQMPELRKLTVEISTECLNDEISQIFLQLPLKIEVVKVGGGAMVSSIVNAVCRCIGKWPKLRSINVDLMKGAEGEIPFELRTACKLFHA